MKPTTEQITDFVTSLDLEGLNVLGEQYRLQREKLGRSAFHQFMPGDKVWFKSKDGHRIPGKVVRRLRKNILIESIFGNRWRVPPNLLKRSKSENK
jgi:hypothetical protein